MKAIQIFYHSAALKNFKDALKNALEKEIESDKYPWEIKHGLKRGMDAIKKAPNKAAVIEIAIGIYNWGLSWINEKDIGYSTTDLSLKKFIQQEYKSLYAEEGGNDWSKYLRLLGSKGILAAPFRFQPKQYDDPINKAQTNLPFLQGALLNYLSDDIFATDSYALYSKNNNNNNESDDEDDTAAGVKRP